ncbi:MAG: hypothetical protein K6T92_06635 [Candidatus Rokubacteria bacterium]|nr:hypothetical protein [Candidatus Rokubacteria bacterium]
MGDLHSLSTGPVSPIVAAIFGALGSLLGILLITQARRRTGWRRLRLVAYAIVALALSAVFLPALVTVLALKVDGSVLLLAPAPLGYSLAAAAGGTVLALPLLCFGRPGSLRQVISGILFVAAIGATGVLMAASLTTGLPTGAQSSLVGVAIALACVTGFGLAAALAATRTLRRALGTAALLGLGLATVYHVAGAGLTLRPGLRAPVAAADVVGLSPHRIGLPAIVTATAVVAFVGYFTLGTATLRDLRRIFEPEADVEEIEPWMIEQVSRRVALTSTAYSPVPGWPDVWARDEPTVAVHAVPIVGRGIADAFAHRARPALPSEAAALPLDDEEPTAADAPATTAWPPADLEVDLDLDVALDLEPGDGATGVTSGLQAGDWPAPGRNEPAAARRNGTRLNSRYAAKPTDQPDEPDPFGDADPDAWVTRLRALAATRPDAGEPDRAAVAIVHDYRAGSPLPRRNARPMHRP